MDLGNEASTVRGNVPKDKPEMTVSLEVDDTCVNTGQSVAQMNYDADPKVLDKDKPIFKGELKQIRVV